MLNPFCGEITSFLENVCFMAAVLNPVFTDHWIDMDVAGVGEIQTNQARSSTRQLIEELAVKKAKRTIGICNILMELLTSAMSSSMGIQSFSSEDDIGVSADYVTVTVTVTHTPSTA